MTRLLLPFLIVLTLLTFSLPITSLAQQQDDTIHTVQPGETLFSISRIYDVSVDEIRNWNQLESNQLSPGQTLRIRLSAGEEGTVHIVEPGESMFGISRQYNVTIAEIQQWNNLETSDVNVGQELVIYEPGEGAQQETLPPPTEMEQTPEEERESIVRRAAEEPGNTTYTVRTGDSLYQIAREHDMTVDEIKALNNMDSDMLRVGQRIIVRETTSAPSIAETAEESTPQGKFVRYRIESGEAGRDLLRKFRMSERELRSLNPGLQVENISPGQQVTVLLPPNRNFENPYRRGATLENLGEVSVHSYSDNDIASPTTSGELYNPDQLTAAHSNMALGNIVYIENPANGKGVLVKINDRHSGDGLKLSHKAFDMLGFSAIEEARVTIYLDN